MSFQTEQNNCNSATSDSFCVCVCGSFAAGKFRAKGINNMSFEMQAGSDTLKHTDTHTHA